MPYLQNLKTPPTGYHVARWHMSGKLWLSETEYATDTEIKESVKLANDRLSEGSFGMVTRFFVWHAGLSATDLEAHKAESVSNKII